VIIATRSLKLSRPGGDTEIQVRISAPEKAKIDWICRFEIDWPDAKAERWGAGSDAVQALLIAMQMIGAEIYASNYHDSGKLRWLVADRGYGFPVTNNIRDLLVGDDKAFL
jgi:hypothetical protein